MTKCGKCWRVSYGYGECKREVAGGFVGGGNDYNDNDYDVESFLRSLMYLIHMPFIS